MFIDFYVWKITMKITNFQTIFSKKSKNNVHAIPIAFKYPIYQIQRVSVPSTSIYCFERGDSLSCIKFKFNSPDFHFIRHIDSIGTITPEQQQHQQNQQYTNNFPNFEATLWPTHTPPNYNRNELLSLLVLSLFLSIFLSIPLFLSISLLNH